MTAVFISYRRSTDRQSAARVREQMTRFFDVEDLFLDSESIKAGEDWGDSLSLAIGSAKACLVMIGPNWLAASDEQGRQRLFLENDWVRREIEIALARRLSSNSEHTGSSSPRAIGRCRVRPQ